MHIHSFIQILEVPLAFWTFRTTSTFWTAPRLHPCHWIVIDTLHLYAAVLLCDERYTKPTEARTQCVHRVQFTLAIQKIWLCFYFTLTHIHSIFHSLNVFVVIRHFFLYSLAVWPLVCVDFFSICCANRVLSVTATYLVSFSAKIKLKQRQKMNSFAKFSRSTVANTAAKNVTHAPKLAVKQANDERLLTVDIKTIRQRQSDRMHFNNVHVLLEFFGKFHPESHTNLWMNEKLIDSQIIFDEIQLLSSQSKKHYADATTNVPIDAARFRGRGCITTTLQNKGRLPRWHGAINSMRFVWILLSLFDFKK